MVLIIKDKRNLAIAQTLALLRAVEDDVLHPAAAKRFRALLAKNPAHRIRQIGLAASIRADNAGNTLVKDDDRSIRKGLEAVYFQSFQPHDLRLLSLIP